MNRMTSSYPSLLKNSFPFKPTEDQEEALEKLAYYLAQGGANDLFLLQGYAGTGKTTLIRALVQALEQSQRQHVLLAPTGRAAKVMAQYSGSPAFTIHKFIYQLSRDGLGRLQYQVRAQRGKEAVIIVDEASMIHDRAGLQQGGLLQDLIQFKEQGRNCQLILVGDTAQLPPVHTALSPAMDLDHLRRAHHHEVQRVELRQVMRQQEGSEILRNATALRENIRQENLSLPEWQCGQEVVKLKEGYQVEESLQDAYSSQGAQGCLIITRSNKRAVMYNQQVRQRILWQEDELAAGDLLMIVKNNYYWLPAGRQARFIANGDIAELLEIYEYQELYNRRFARVKIQLIDYPDDPPLEVWVHLDTIDAPSPSLSQEEFQAFGDCVLEDYAELNRKADRIKALRENPFYQALQIKFAYAVTGHKAQGGQWPVVFVENPWLPEGEIDLDYLRWLYTAFTRAQEKLYLLGFTGAEDF